MIDFQAPLAQASALPFSFYGATGFAIGVYMVGLSSMTNNAVTRSKMRREQMRASVHHMAEHREALRVVVESEAASDHIKLGLLNVSEGLIDNREFVTRLVNALCNKEGRARPDSQQQDTAIESDLASLSADAPEVAAAFRRALLAGLFAGALRWPETADRLPELLQIAVDSPNRETDVLTKAMQSAPTRADFPPGAIPIAC